MKATKNLLAAVALSVGLLSATGANAVLTLSADGTVVNDTDLNINWLANANLAASNTFGVSGINANGTMNWNTAQSWIGAMNASNSGTGYLGFSDWRLANADPSCGFSYNCTGSEMGHLFYNELGGVAGQSILITHNTNLNLFQNVQSYYYWSGTEYAPNPSNAWTFTSHGGQDAPSKNNLLFAWAVRPGQIAAVTAPVPEPEIYAMLLAGLGLLGVARRRLTLR